MFALRVRYLRLVDNQSKTGNKKSGTEGQIGQDFPSYAGHTVITSRIYSPTSERIQLVPNLGQSVTQTAVRGRCGGAHTNGRCGGIDT